MGIDPEFMHKRPSVEKHHTHEVFGPLEAPARLGIHGRIVGVDFDICTGDGACIDTCPVNVFEWYETPGCASPNDSGQPIVKAAKADPIREPDCINCLACESVCPVQAIKITMT
ncbi:MAG: ferredoxin family protein [Euryarchaeota archaeon]|nr:ferredoxin family protein [Euryarchaeota archaeon]